MSSRRPWLSVRGLAPSPWARLFLVALALAQMVAPGWNLWALGGSVPVVATNPGIAHGFQIAAGPGRQAIICVPPQAAAKPLRAWVVLRFGPKLAQKSPGFIGWVIPYMPGQGAPVPGLFGHVVSYPLLTLVGPQLLVSSSPAAYSGRAPPFSRLFSL